MTKIAIGTWAYGVAAKAPVPLDELLDRIAAAGYDGIQYGPFAPHPVPTGEPRDPVAKALARDVADRGLALVGLAGDFGDTSFLRGPSPDAYLAAFDRNVEICDALGIDVLRVDSLDPPETVYELGIDLALERAIAVWGECARRAERYAVTVAWEFEPCFAFNEPRHVIAIASALRDTAFGIQYDTAHGHMVAEVGARHVEPGRTLAGGQLELLAELDGLIADVHVLDSDGSLNDGPYSSNRTTRHVPIGEGDVDFRSVIPALAAARGEGDWWCADLCFALDPDGHLTSTREKVADLLAAVPESA